MQLKFKKGDAVALKHNGQKMTVQVGQEESPLDKYTESKKDRVKCVWHTKAGVVKDEWFDIELLINCSNSGVDQKNETLENK